jgi:hypothetical protein
MAFGIFGVTTIGAKSSILAVRTASLLAIYDLDFEDGKWSSISSSLPTSMIALF